jgi:hypothetical protein
MDPDVLIINRSGWEQSRNVSEGSLSTSNEQLALIGFAHILGSSMLNNDPGIADVNDVRKEARLLMSLACSPPTNITEESGRITPQSDVSSCYSTSSRRDSFSFTCPSLSLENHSQGFKEDGQGKNTEPSSETRTPAALLGRVLKVDDKDALRLSSEAMARNTMQSYQNALAWRIQSWANALGRVLAHKEKVLKQEQASEDEIKKLLTSSEAQLILKLREIADTIQVLDASTTFKVSPQRVPKTDASEPPSKKQRVEEEEDMTSLEEHEYQYHVAHMLTVEVFLNILTPGAGYIQIDLQVPGTMKGTFLSTESEGEQLTDVTIELNTEMLASMIEKSSRMVVRSSVEALLKEEPQKRQAEETQKKAKVPTATSPVRTCTPKQKYSDERVSNLMVVTPRDTTSPSSFGESDIDDKPALLSIPDNFTSGRPKKNLRMLTPQPSRARNRANITDFAALSPPKKKTFLPTVVTPYKESKPFIEERRRVPILPLPVLVEVACAAMLAN